MWTSPDLEAKARFFNLKRPLAYNVQGSWDLPIWSAKSCIQGPSPISNAKSWGISWILLSSWKYVITLFSSFVAMDERRQYILVVLALFVVIKHLIVALLALQQILMYKQSFEITMVAVLFLKEVKWTLHGLYKIMRG